MPTLLMTSQIWKPNAGTADFPIRRAVLLSWLDQISGCLVLSFSFRKFAHMTFVSCDSRITNKLSTFKSNHG